MTWETWLGVILLIPVVVYFVVHEINWQWEGFDRFKKKKGGK